MDKRNINVTKYYRTTFSFLQILGSIPFAICEYLAIRCLFLDKNIFPQKLLYFVYFFSGGIAIEALCLVITSILLRFVFKKDINYSEDCDTEINDTDFNDDEEDIDDEVKDLKIDSPKSTNPQTSAKNKSQKRVDRIFAIAILSTIVAIIVTIIILSII